MVLLKSYLELRSTRRELKQIYLLQIGKVQLLLKIKVIVELLGLLQQQEHITNQDLLEQQLIDCDLESQGCEDVNLDNSLNRVFKNGVTTATNYPYTSKTEACKRQTGQFKIKGYQKVDPNQIQSAIIKSPIAASVDGSSWTFYNSGVFNRCTFEELNHDV
ncbi:unnamed protein product [Paramecium primaurelia]|uniref:Peptidase C1A papain C-terminal domain-containing protein n=1 Tax=Paramecium primaurelia TaxID=5886 RepID=A0A8S1NTU4_PARPR|nr:unnamed protein product [Paramecium primaurelia]